MPSHANRAAASVGRASAMQLGAEGARLVLTDHDETALASVAKGLGGSERAIAVSGDLAESGFETCLSAAAVARYGRLDGAVICLDDHGSGPLARTRPRWTRGVRAQGSPGR